MEILFVLQNRNIFYHELPMKGRTSFAFLVPSHFGSHNLPDAGNPGTEFDFDRLLQAGPTQNAMGTSSLVRRLLDDPRTLYLAERRLASRSFVATDPFGRDWTAMGAFGHGFVVAKWSNASLTWLDEVAPKVIVFDSTPHDLQAWVFAHAAEFRGIPTVVVKQTPMHWRFGYSTGVDAQSWVQVGLKEELCEVDRERERARVASLIRTNQQEYLAAEPTYMKRNLRRSLQQHEQKGRPSLLSSLSALISRARLINQARTAQVSDRRYGALTAARQKHRSLQDFKDSATSTHDLDGPESKFVFFLHFQWERTSLPEGGPYSQQIQAILWLREWLPKHVKLVVKEHPVMLSKFTANTLRPSGFYSFISSIPGVILAGSDVDSFRLIDGAKMVGTITGTVGFQAVCRARPVMTFGKANYSGHPAVFSPSEKGPSFTNIVSKFKASHPSFSSSFLEEFLTGFLPYTFCGESAGDDPYSPSAVQKSLAKMITGFGRYWEIDELRKAILNPPLDQESESRQQGEYSA